MVMPRLHRENTTVLSIRMAVEWRNLIEHLGAQDGVGPCTYARRVLEDHLRDRGFQVDAPRERGTPERWVEEHTERGTRIVPERPAAAWEIADG